MLDKPADTRRDTLTRYNAALQTGRWQTDITVIHSRFVANHRLGADHPIRMELETIFNAHAERVAGRSSPKACDDAAKKVIG